MTTSTGHAVDLGPVAGNLGQSIRQPRGLEVRRARDPSTDRRASDRLSRASSDGIPDVSLPVVRPVASLLGGLQLGDDPGQPLGNRVVDLARPSAARSSRTPASRAWFRSWAWRPAFSSSAASSLASCLAPLLALLGDLLAEEPAGPDRERLDDDDRHPDRQNHSGFVGNPPITVLTRTDVAKTPPMSSGHGRSTVAWKKPVIMKMKNRVSRVSEHRRDDQEPDEVDDHPNRMGLFGRGGRVYIDVDPHGGNRDHRRRCAARSPWSRLDQLMPRTADEGEGAYGHQSVSPSRSHRS